MNLFYKKNIHHNDNFHLKYYKQYENHLRMKLKYRNAEYAIFTNSGTFLLSIEKNLANIGDKANYETDFNLEQP